MSARHRLMRSRAAVDADPLAEFASDVHYYLTQQPRQLPSKYLYDALGSALFDAICQLPWYGITRAELRLLARHGRDVFARLGRVSTIVELGSGSGEKLLLLARAASSSQAALTIHLVDVSRRALELSTRALGELDATEIVLHEASYESGLDEAVRETRGHGRRLVLFLGSNIGNFDWPGAEALLHTIRSGLSPGDGLLLGSDLTKPESDLLLAYDDPLGVTAAFNLNLLVRINRELGGEFDLSGFEHRAVWSERESRVEMHLVARRPQRVRVAAADLDIQMRSGENIWTESSYKYRPEQVVRLQERAGFRQLAQWIDAADRFALTLVEAA